MIEDFRVLVDNNWDCDVLECVKLFDDAVDVGLFEIVIVVLGWVFGGLVENIMPFVERPPSS